MLTSLEKYVLTYEDINGKVVINVKDYYARYIAILEPKFKRHSFYNEPTVICPLHDDHDPSLGLMKDKRFPKVQLYHCLGCGAAGTVIRLHQRIQSIYHGREVSTKEACIELCRLFNVPIPDDNVFANEDFDKKVQNNFTKLQHITKFYTEKDFARNLQDLRVSGNITLDKINSESVKMIATTKGLYTR